MDGFNLIFKAAEKKIAFQNLNIYLDVNSDNLDGTLLQISLQYCEHIYWIMFHLAL